MITVEAIKLAVAREFRVPAAFLVEPSSVSDRKDCMKNPREVSHPRQVAMTLAYLLTEASCPQIGKRFGGRDHTTVFHARREVEKRRRADPEVREAMRRITRHLLAKEGRL